MTNGSLNRRRLVAAGGAFVATSVAGMLLPAQAKGLAPTPSMWGGSNNYRPGAPIVDRIEHRIVRGSENSAVNHRIVHRGLHQAAPGSGSDQRPRLLLPDHRGP